jgi:ribose transport system substrate-binding protein
MRTTRIVTSLAALSLAVIGLGACSNDSGGSDTPAGSGGADAGDKPVIGLVMKSLGNSYFQEMQKGADEFAASDDTFTLKSVGTQSETDIDGQIEAVNNMISQKVDAIVLAPADSRALVAPLIEADAAGIKIVNIDVKLDDEALKAANLDIPFVGPDNIEGARLSGEVLAKALGEGGKVVILEGLSGAANGEQRKEGFDQAIADGKLELLESTTANWETDQANTVFTNMLAAHPDIQGVMTANDSMALGVIAALEAANNTTIKIASFDNVPEVQPYLESGQLLATLDQYGSQQAQFGIENALKLLKGESVEQWVKTPVKVITADNN